MATTYVVDDRNGLRILAAYCLDHDSLLYCVPRGHRVLEVFDTNAYGDQLPIVDWAVGGDPNLFLLSAAPYGEVRAMVEVTRLSARRLGR